MTIYSLLLFCTLIIFNNNKVVDFTKEKDISEFCVKQYEKFNIDKSKLIDLYGPVLKRDTSFSFNQDDLPYVRRDVIYCKEHTFAFTKWSDDSFYCLSHITLNPEYIGLDSNFTNYDLEKVRSDEISYLSTNSDGSLIEYYFTPNVDDNFGFQPFFNLYFKNHKLKQLLLFYQLR